MSQFNPNSQIQTVIVQGLRVSEETCSNMDSNYMAISSSGTLQNFWNSIIYSYVLKSKIFFPLPLTPGDLTSLLGQLS